jgi:periplasmic protein TonB
VKTRPFLFADIPPTAALVVSIGANSSLLEGTMAEHVRLEKEVFKHTMFADSLLDGSWAKQARRGYTTLTSFGLQAIMVSLLLLMPLLRTIVLPAVRTVSTPISMGRPEPMPLVARPRSGGTSVAVSNPAMRHVWNGPARETKSTVEDDPVPQLGGHGSGIIQSGEPVGFPIPISGTQPQLPPPPPPQSRTFRTSKMLEGSLYHRVQPLYPPLARAARIQGEVVLAATISKTGAIENLQILRGHPMLVTAAIDAVRQWRYHPYVLNNEPVEVETQITVNFTLSGN